MCQPEGADIDALADWVYSGLILDEPAIPELLEHQRELSLSATWLSERAILTPLNVTVDAINRAFTDTFPGEAVELKSADAVKEADGVAVTEEFLNTITLPGFPAHTLRLKKGMPLMLLRNLAPAEGLCNGTRLILHRVVPGNWLLECEIISPGKHHGDIVHISRLTLDADDDKLPFSWSRRQFPVCSTARTRRLSACPYPQPNGSCVRACVLDRYAKPLR
jgi:hypothetical protein